MDYEQYTINETPVEEQEETKNEIVPVEASGNTASGNTAAGVAFGALLTVGIFAAFKGVKRAVKHVKAKAAAKKAEACEDDEWEDEPINEPEVVLEETTEKTKKNK